MQLSYFILDAFTNTRFAGNPAGVIFCQEPLSESQMRAIAGELSLESAFLFPPTVPEADYTIAYYTGVQRVPLCGHDTIALATALAHSGRISTPGVLRLSTDVGIISVSVAKDRLVTMSQALPHYGASVETAVIAEALGLPLSAIADTGLPAQVVSTGTPFLIVPVMHRAQLNALTPDMAKLIACGKSIPGNIYGFYLWSWEMECADALAHARCFAPAIGLPEDPATGSASGAFGAYLARHGRLKPDANGVACFSTEQGYAMGRPGSVHVRIKSENRHVTQVEVGGYATLVAEGSLWI